MIHLLDVSNNTLFVYYLLSNIFYLALLITAFIAAATHRRRLSSLRLETLDESPFTPPISILVPAHNEATTIHESVAALLSLEYPALQIVVVNDGSTDRTLDVLTAECGLRRTSVLYVPQVASAPVRAVYTSDLEERLIVVDKVPGGTKADAANAGLNAATSPYVAVIDADSVLERDALLRIGAEIFSAHVDVVATGGIVRVLNGSKVSGGQIQEVRLPQRGIEVLQVIEYLRSFLIGREAWGAMNMLPIISGAFGVFNRERLLRVGGFRPDAIGEDIDLVVRMHRSLLQDKKHYRVPFIPEPTCWTQVPQTLGALGAQRARWQKGLLDVLWKNRDMLFRARYGRFGCIMLPYLCVFELAAPVVELVGFSTIALAAVLGVLSKTFLIQFAIYGYAFATLLSIGAVVLEEITFRRYHRWTDVARLLLYCLAEHFPYRQINMWWRLKGMWQYMRGNVAWEKSERSAFAPSVK
jgi:cellulose synthase/poly-beta-1,6-N-acetylglucosamine synthase-like glycosyltransferase